MTDPAANRPRQVTLAAWLLMAGSALAVATIFQRLAGLNTLESRAAVQQSLTRPPWSDLGIGLDDALDMIRTLSMVTAGCATAAGILGYQVLRRSKPARVAVTVLAVPLFFAGAYTVGFLTSLVAMSAVFLWVQPARSWFDGTAPPERRAAAAVAAPPPPVTTSSSAPPATAPPPNPADRVASPGYWPPAHPATCDRRPGAVLWACVLTWVCTGIAVLGLAASAISVAIDPQRLLDQLHRDNPTLTTAELSDQMLLAATYVAIVVVIVWCVSAAALAVLTFRRVGWARIVLVVSAAGCTAMCLVGAALGQVLMVFPLGAAVATIGLLVRPDTAPWFDQRPLR